MFVWLVDWGNGFIGGFNFEFEQLWNSPKELLINDLKFYEVELIRVITPAELDRLRGFHRPAFEEYIDMEDVKLCAESLQN